MNCSIVGILEMLQSRVLFRCTMLELVYLQGETKGGTYDAFVCVQRTACESKATKIH